MADLEKIKQQLSQMETLRSGFDSHWQELIDYMLWFRPDIVESNYPGRKKMAKIKDSTATQSLMLFGAGFSAKEANAATKWFKCVVEDEYYKDHRPSKLWLEQLENKFYDVFRLSNFYGTDKEANVDWAGFGTSIIYSGKHPRNHCYYQNVPLGQCYMALNQYGEIDTLFRKMTWTARQVEQKWGNQISAKTESYLRSNKPNEPVTIVHAVYPRNNWDPGKMDNLNMPFASVYLELDHQHQLSESGYRLFPYAVSRYYVMDGEVNGRGLGMTALPDVKELQTRVTTTTMAGQLRMQPPMALSHDGFTGQTIKRVPGGYTFVRTDGGRVQDHIGQFPVAGDLNWSDKSIEDMQRHIRAIFYHDLMSLGMDKQVTLGEFLQMAQEKMQYLGEALGRLQYERRQPLFDRTFDILWDLGEVPPPPPELIGEDGHLKYRLEYISPLAKAQKMSESQGIIQATGYLSQAAAVYPELPDLLDADEAGRIVLENQGVPARIIRDDKALQEIRADRAKAQQEQAQMQMLMEAAKTMPALSKGPEPGSPAEQVNQQLQEGAGNV